MIVTICADGTTLHLTIIFKGQNFMIKWTDNNVANASSVHLSATGLKFDGICRLAHSSNGCQED